MVYCIIIFLMLMIFLYLKSESDFFFQDKENLAIGKKIMINQLENYGRNDDDIQRFCNAYDYFCKNPKEYDGSTIVRDLFDFKHKGKRLSTASMWHDYEYIYNGANKNLILNWKANWIYFNDLINNGKGAHTERLIGLILISFIFVPYKIIKK